MDCERWLEKMGTPSRDTVYSLLNTLLNGMDCGEFECSSRDARYFIRRVNSDGWLILPSDDARSDFLNLIKTRYCGKEDIQAWYESKAPAGPKLADPIFSSVDVEINPA